METRNLVAFAFGFLFDFAFSVPLSPLTISLLGNGNTRDDSRDNPGDGDGSGNPMSEWSSTIGIVTAIIGNVFISFALNIQRYAHIRIQREYEHNRYRNGWKRSASRIISGSERLSSSNYGTLANEGEDERADEQEHIDADRVETNGRSTSSEEISRVGFHRYTDEDGEGRGRDASLDDGNPGPDRLQQSFMSDRTLTPLEKSQISNERKSYLKSPYWWSGIILMTIGEAGNFLAYGFAPASIVSPLGVVALISNCLIAPFMLKETFRGRDLLGVLVSVAGAVTIVFSAKTSETKIGPGEIWGMISTWEFELYLGLTIVLILGLMWASQKYGRKSILIDLGLVGLFGGYTALSTKAIASLLSFTLWHIITFPITYGLVAILFFSALMQIRYINRALQRFDSTQVIPTQFVLFTISVILGSAVLYRDFESTTVARAGKFIGGCTLTFLGVYLITSGRTRADVSESESDSDEEAIGLLGTERYRDSIEWQRESRHSHSEQTLNRTSSPAVQATDSRPRSLLSDEADYAEDDGLQTPRAPLSSDPSSSVPSISGVSSLSGSPAQSPKPFTENPWAVTPEEHGESAIVSEPQTPTQIHSLPTQILLQYPSAPGITGPSSDRNPQSPPHSPLQATLSRPKTPPTAARKLASSRKPNTGSRSSFSKRFAPGPLLQPLSGTLSAVVAESLLRGEGSPRSQQERTSSKTIQKGKKRASIPYATNEGTEIRYNQEETPLETEYETNTGVTGGKDEILRRDNTPVSPRLPVSSSANRSSTQERISTLSGSPLQKRKDSSRNRSLSDSWSGGLAWLRGSIRGNGKYKQKDKARPSVAAGPSDNGDNDARPSRD
ncbi:hypothetical protein AJ78_05085 [Emergomyces pasteurianus Ep9510]|uniref:DUF803 domain membrane protein n=1 Tax=Emergomyces pasteurianus Ep9510 TaxID=1447872 RepID=A0A1J9QEK4_9EURO|nr:hypothetical protein AJ78_05085 [Emergomyces pasteurianus Ep9510]